MLIRWVLWPCNINIVEKNEDTLGIMENDDLGPNKETGIQEGLKTKDLGRRIKEQLP